MSVDDPLRPHEVFIGRWILFVVLLFAPLLLYLELLTDQNRWWIYAVFWLFLTLVPEGFGHIEQGQVYGSYLDGGTSLSIALIFWLGIGLGYTRLTRDFRFRYFVLGAYPLIFLVMLLVHGGLRLFGISLQSGFYI